MLQQLGTDPAAPAFLGGHAGRTAASERIQHNGVRLGKGFNQRLQDAERLLGQVVAIAGVFPWHHVRQRFCRQQRARLRQQVGTFILIADKRRL